MNQPEDQISLGEYNPLNLSVAMDCIAQWMLENGKTGQQIGDILTEEVARLEEEIETGQF